MSEYFLKKTAQTALFGEIIAGIISVLNNIAFSCSRKL
jgi:hypothetical protein